MAAPIPIKKSGFIFSLCFHRNGADLGALSVAFPYSEHVRKSPFIIRLYGDSDASEQQSGRGWNGPSWQLKDRSSEGLDRAIQKSGRREAVIMMNSMHCCKRLKDRA